MSLETFTNSYIETAFWAETANGVPEDDESGNWDVSLRDYGFTSDDLAPSALETIKADCADFYNANQHLFDDDEQAGHDFYLTRNGHGAGFWDGDYPEPNGTELTKASKAYGSVHFYVGDDQLVYVS